MTVARLAIAMALVAALVTTAPTARAQTGATLVAIVTAEPNAPLTRRVRAELQGLGVDVIVLKPPAEATTLRAPLEQAARSVGAVAAVRLVTSSEGKIEVWVADRVTGKAVVRELDASGGSASDAAVAIGTVELLRASLMELHSGEPPRGDAPATERVQSLAFPARAAAWSPRLGLAVGGGVEPGLRGLGASADANLGVWLRLGPRFGARAIGYLSLSPAHAETAAGSVDVRSQLFGATLTYDFADAAGTWVPSVAVGLAAAHVTTSAAATAPFVGTTEDAWSAAPLAGGGIAFGFARGLRVRTDGLAAWALPGTRVQTPTTTVGRWGAPQLMLSLGLEILWGP
jgi:hypothetical protein